MNFKEKERENELFPRLIKREDHITAPISRKTVQEQEEMFQMENKPVKFVKRKDFVTIPISRKIVQKQEKEEENMFKMENSYVLYPVALNEFEKTLLLEAIKNKYLLSVDITISLLRKDYSIYYLPLTQYQIKKIRKAEKEKETEINLKFSIGQIQYFKISKINNVLI